MLLPSLNDADFQRLQSIPNERRRTHFNLFPCEKCDFGIYLKDFYVGSVYETSKWLPQEIGQISQVFDSNQTCHFRQFDDGFDSVFRKAIIVNDMSSASSRSFNIPHRMSWFSHPSRVLSHRVTPIFLLLLQVIKIYHEPGLTPTTSYGHSRRCSVFKTYPWRILFSSPNTRYYEQCIPGFWRKNPLALHTFVIRSSRSVGRSVDSFLLRSYLVRRNTWCLAQWYSYLSPVQA